LFTLVFLRLLSLLPLISVVPWRDDERARAAARAERDRAELLADTAIAVNVPRCAQPPKSCGRQQLAQCSIGRRGADRDRRENHRRRVIEALDGPVHATSQRESVNAEVARAELPAAADTTENLPALVERRAVDRVAGSLIPTIPTSPRPPPAGFARSAPFRRRAVDTTTQPLRAARQVFEEVEEITFLLKAQPTR